MKDAKKISVIIAAYNEEPRIANVLSVVEHHPLIDEIIVINDGSQDKTVEVIRKFNVKLIDNEKNMGKTLSVKRGIEAAKNNLIMLLDADLNGLNAESIDKLARPVLDGRVDWTLSLRGNSFGFMRLMHMDWVSGERLVPKQLLLDQLIWSRPDIGYGLETLMNRSLLSRGATFQSVYLKELRITNKSKKNGLVKGLRDEIRMLRQIMKVASLHEIIWQFITMSRLNRKYNKQKN